MKPIRLWHSWGIPSDHEINVCVCVCLCTVLNKLDILSFNTSIIRMFITWYGLESKMNQTYYYYYSTKSFHSLRIDKLDVENKRKTNSSPSPLCNFYISSWPAWAVPPWEAQMTAAGKSVKGEAGSPLAQFAPQTKAVRLKRHRCSRGEGEPRPPSLHQLRYRYKNGIKSLALTPAMQEATTRHILSPPPPTTHTYTHAHTNTAHAYTHIHKYIHQQTRALRPL